MAQHKVHNSLANLTSLNLFQARFPVSTNFNYTPSTHPLFCAVLKN